MEYKKYTVTWRELRQIEILASSPKNAIDSAKIMEGKCIDKCDHYAR